MPSDSSARRLKLMDSAKALHEILDSVRQLSYMKHHSESLNEVFNVKLEMTYAKAPGGRQKKGQTYELHRNARSKPAGVEESELEQRIWEQWNFAAFAQH